MYTLYSLVMGVGALLSSPYWVYKALRERKYLHNFRQRLGWTMPHANGILEPLWIHAVSVGEVLAAKPLLTALRSVRPDLSVIVTTVTLTGQALAQKELTGAAALFYFPFDWDFSVRRYLNRMKPRAVVLLETELWPNFLKNCRKRSVPIFLVNGRISERSQRRYRLIGSLTRSMMAQVTAIGAQSAEDRRRFLKLGAQDGQVRVTGNLKFDFPPPVVDGDSEWIRNIRDVLGIAPDVPVVVVGSSMKGEEMLFVDCFRQVRKAVPGTRLILAPRHPERFSEVAQILAASGIPFIRRTRLRHGATADILLLDSIGELRSVYALASVAVIGGSFLPFGGHNLLEPAALGKAIVFGPEMSNFRELAALFLQEQAARQCSLQNLAQALTELLGNARALHMLGERASLTFRRNQGATERTLSFLLPHLG
jgi:3-deoxy-D-manno-octulosonic-acid transferase